MSVSACQSAVAADGLDLSVEVADPHLGEQLLVQARDIRARILAELGAISKGSAHASDTRPIRIVEVGEEAGWDEAIAGTADDRERVVRLRTDTTDMDLTLAHEIAHLSLGSDWDVLPPAVEEGLVDLLGANALGALARLRADRAEGLTRPLGGLVLRLTWILPGASAQPLTASAVCSFQPPEAPANREPVGSPAELLDDPRQGPRSFDPIQDPIRYGVAFVLVEHVAKKSGLPALHEVCVDAADAGSDRVPASRFFELAGVTTPAAKVDFETLALWLGEDWDETTERACLTRRVVWLAPVLAEAISWSRWVGRLGAAPEERRTALESWDVRISVGWNGPSPPDAPPVALRDLPALLEAVAGIP